MYAFTIQHKYTVMVIYTASIPRVKIGNDGPGVTFYNEWLWFTSFTMMEPGATFN